MTWFAYARAGDERFLEQFGLCFEEFETGQRFKHRPGVTVSQQDNADEALDTLNAAMVHYDAHYSAQTAWKKPLMVSTITLQRMIGMASHTFGRKQYVLGVSEIAMTAPVFGGDTLYAESEILATRPSENPSTGVVSVATQAVKPDGTVVGRVVYEVAVYRAGARPDEHGVTMEPASEERFRLYRTEAEGVLIEHYGLYFEDCVPGETFMHWPRRSFFGAEATEHAWRSLEVGPQYHDLAWLNTHEQGRQRIQETWVISAATALTTRTFGRVMANLGWTDIRLPTPVYAGDTIRSESTIVACRESKSRPNEGIVTVDTRSFNQRDEPVLSYRRNLLVYRRSAATPYAAAGY